MTVRPNRHLIDLATTILNITAPAVAAALTNAAREIHVLDSTPTYSGGGGSRGGNTISDPTGDATVARTNIDRDVTVINDLMRSLIETNHELIVAANRLATRNQAPQKNQQQLCRDNQTGKAGTIQWGDPLCPLPSTKSGLCSKHYMAWWRYRTAHGIDTSNDHQPAR